MCKDCLRIGQTLFPDASEEDVGNFLMSATCFPFGHPRDVWRTAYSSWRAGAGTIRGAIRYAHLELDRGMRKFRRTERA
jgi:hypothetical protein